MNSEKRGRDFFCPEIGETDPVSPIFASSLCSWLLPQTLSITKRYKSALLAQIKLTHIVANNNAASLVCEKEPLNLTLLKPE